MVFGGSHRATLRSWLNDAWSTTATPGAPAPDEDGTRVPAAAWDLRTLIAVLPPGAPWSYLNLNVTVGLTGTPFDRPRRWRGPPSDALDFQLCLDGPAGAVTWKRYYSVAAEATVRPGVIDTRLGDRLRVVGRWPECRFEVSVPEKDLELQAAFHGWPDIQWWTRVPPIYTHYTTFGACRLTWRHGARRGAADAAAAHDHGWGARPPVLQAPRRRFRYEVLPLPGGGAAASLWADGPLGLRVRRAAAVRALPTWDRAQWRCASEVLEWAVVPNAEDQPCRVPRRWTVWLTAPDRAMQYEAQLATSPQPVLADGVMYAFDFEARGSALPGGALGGVGYAEQFGTAWRAPNPGRRL